MSAESFDLVEARELINEQQERMLLQAEQSGKVRREFKFAVGEK